MLKRSRLNRTRKDSISKLKKKLWELCRQIVFKRYQNTQGEVFCYTSGQGPLIGANRQLGHFIPSSVGGVGLRYDLDNLRPQSYRDNIHLSGNWPVYYEKMVAEIGLERVQGLMARKQQYTKADILFYQRKISEYQTLLAETEYEEKNI